MEASPEDSALIQGLGYGAPEGIGSGEFASVYRVCTEEIPFALKLSHAGTTEQRDRIPREAEALCCFGQSFGPEVSRTRPRHGARRSSN